MSDDVHATVRFRDESLVEALEEAEGEHGSRSEAIRHAVATAYGGGDEVEEDEDTGLPVKAKEGHRKLVEWTGRGGRIELDTAESILANHLNIQKGAVRKVVIQPLKREDVIALHQGIHNVSIVVGDIEGDDVEAGDEPTADTESTSSEAATDGGEARDRIDELAAAGAEVADGE